MTVEEAKQIQIIDLLLSWGYEPHHSSKGGNQLWYCSPLRAEKKPSFNVKVSDNCWFDFGGSGGNVLDLVMAHENVDFNGALAYLHNRVGGGLPLASTAIRKVQEESRDNEIILQEVQPLQNRALIQQLQAKGIPYDLAREHFLVEGYYTNGGKRYFGYMMKNDRGGYEIANKYFKGATKGKSPTTRVGEDRSRVTVFEGMTDFLSALQYHQILSFKTDVVILHSLAFLYPLVKEWKETEQYKTAYMYLDNDRPGIDHLQMVQEELEGATKVKPMNHFYKGFKDVNEFWTQYSINRQP